MPTKDRTNKFEKLCVERQIEGISVTFCFSDEIGKTLSVASISEKQYKFLLHNPKLEVMTESETAEIHAARGKIMPNGETVNLSKQHARRLFGEVKGTFH